MSIGGVLQRETKIHRRGIVKRISQSYSRLTCAHDLLPSHSDPDDDDHRDLSGGDDLPLPLAPRPLPRNSGGGDVGVREIWS